MTRLSPLTQGALPLDASRGQGFAAMRKSMRKSMATPQTWHWAAHILSKGKDKLICDRCKSDVVLPIEPSKDFEKLTTDREKKKYRNMWLRRIRAIGTFVTKHRYC